MFCFVRLLKAENENYLLWSGLIVSSEMGIHSYWYAVQTYTHAVQYHLYISSKVGLFYELAMTIINTMSSYVTVMGIHVQARKIILMEWRGLNCATHTLPCPYLEKTSNFVVSFESLFVLLKFCFYTFTHCNYKCI